MALKFDIKPGDHIVLPKGSYFYPGAWEYRILSVEVGGGFQYEVLNGPPAVNTLTIQQMSEYWIPGEVMRIRNILSKYQ